MKNNKSINLKEKEQTTIRLPIELKQKIEKEANRRNMSFNEIVNKFLYEKIQTIHQIVEE